MESITIVKLTKTECAVLSRAHEILQELEGHATCYRLAKVDEVISGLENLLLELEDMGNEFAYRASKEDESQPEEIYPSNLSDWRGTVPESY